MTNAPEQFELFVLPEGVKKVEVEKDTKIPNAATFTVQREDHTVGNILRMQLHQNKHVKFAGYKMPHPLEHYIVLKIQTTNEIDPETAFETAKHDLTSQLKDLEEKFREQVNSKRQDSYFT